MEKISKSKNVLKIAILDAKARYNSLKRDSEDAHMKAQLQQEHMWNLEKIMDDLD